MKRYISNLGNNDHHVSPIKLEVKVTLPKGTSLGSRCSRFRTQVWPQSPVHNHHAHFKILCSSASSCEKWVGRVILLYLPQGWRTMIFC